MCSQWLIKSHAICPCLPGPGSLLFHVVLHYTRPFAVSVLLPLFRMLFPWI